MSFIEELKRRNVFRVGIAYAVSAWVLLQVADLVLDNIEAPGWVMHVLLLVAGLGFVVALVIAWAYELTPEGIKRESEIASDASVTHHTAKKLDYITLGAVGLLIVLLLLDRFAEKGPDTFSAGTEQSSDPDADQKMYPAPFPPSIARKSIAVLPLVNRSVREEDAFFAEGIHDEILTRLSRVSALKVISRTSVMSYKDTDKRMTEIGRELGVATLLEGGVQRAGNRVRINVQLIEAATDKHLWAEVYDRELTADNLFDIQSDITASIANALQAVLSGEERQSLADKPTDNVEAYAHFLRGKASSLVYGRSPQNIDKGIAAFQAALELDPDFAEAWAALAIDWLEKHWQSIQRTDELEQAGAALQHARELAPRAADTLVAQGYYHYWGFRDYQPAIAAFEQALAVEPGNQFAQRGKAYVLRRLGRLDETIDALEKVMALDPLNAQTPADLAWTQAHAGRFAEARRMFLHAMAQDPDNQWNLWTYAEYFLYLNDLVQAIETLGPVPEDAQDFILALHALCGRLAGDAALVERALAAVERQAVRPEFGKLLLLQWDMQRGVEQDPAMLEALARDLERSAETQADPVFELSGLLLVRAALGDLAGLERAMARYNTKLKPDAMRAVEDRNPMLAWAMIGEYDRVLDSAERLVAEFGPWELYHLVMDPLFDGLRGMPRYKALALQYDRWLETVKR